MTRPCRAIEASLGRPALTLNQAERLVLEQHLAECLACRENHALARSITELVTAAPSTLTDAARERALAGAFARAAEGRGVAQPARRSRRLAVALAAAAVFGLGLRFTLHEPASERGGLATQRPHDEEAAPRTRAVATATPNANTLPVPPPPPALDDDWLEVAVAETRQFAHAQVALGAGTRVRFDRAVNMLELASGRVLVDVAPAQGSSFAVLTQNFRVQVLGTQFAVTPERVEVLRGHVQVFARTGASLLRELGPGESFERERTRGPDALGKRERERSANSAAELLHQARLLLASADVAGARALLAQAARLSNSRSERAEAGTLSAECALLERTPERAITAYLSVAERYGELPAGENALFAAAQLSAREQPEATARSLFERYLARYPHGRFVTEARARLAPRAP